MNVKEFARTVLSPILFNIIRRKDLSNGPEGESRGIKINGIPINNTRYAGDTAILAPTLEDLQQIMSKINAIKTKRMIIGR